MFDQILNMVKDHVDNNPQVAQHVPPEQQEAVNQEVAHQVTSGLASQAPTQGGVGSLLLQLQSGLTSVSPVINAIEGGVVSSLTNKFGLPPMATGAIAAQHCPVYCKSLHIKPTIPMITALPQMVLALPYQNSI